MQFIQSNEANNYPKKKLNIPIYKTNKAVSKIRLLLFGIQLGIILYLIVVEWETDTVNHIKRLELTWMSTFSG